MTHAVHHEPTRHVSDTARHYITAVLTVFGVVAAAVGTWLAYGPDDATIRVFDWTWSVADISELWAPWLMIGGGVLAALSTGWETIRARSTSNPWVVALEGLILVAGLFVAGLGVFLLI